MSYPGYEPPSEPASVSPVDPIVSGLNFSGWNIFDLLRQQPGQQPFYGNGPGPGYRPGQGYDYDYQYDQNGTAYVDSPTMLNTTGDRAAWIERGYGPYGGFNRVTPQSPSRPYDYATGSRDLAQDYWQIQYDRQQELLAAQEDAIRAQYRPALDAAMDDLGDLRANAAKVGVPFADYIAARHQIGGTIPAAEGLEGSALPAVNKTYDDASAEMTALLDQVNANYGAEVTTEVTGRVREMEDTIEDVIRTDETAIEAVHERTGQYAQALAQAAYSNDIYAAMAAETRINAELSYRISETEEEVGRHRRSMADAINAARRQAEAEFEYEDPSFEGLRDQSWAKYFEQQGVAPHMAQAARNIYDEVMADPRNQLDEASMRRGLNDWYNTTAMRAIGFGDEQIGEWFGQSPYLANSFRSYDFVDLARRGQTALIERAFKDIPQAPGARGNLDVGREVARRLVRQADNLGSSKDQTGTHLRNMFTQERYISSNFDDIVRSFGPQVTDENVYSVTGAKDVKGIGVHVAPSGYTFPVAGKHNYSNDWGNPRSGGRTHKGTDIMAARGTPIIAGVEGTVTDKGYDALGGWYVYVTDSRGYRHYYAHMDRFSSQSSIGTRVGARTVLGLVGNTGNASGGAPHLHYGIREPKTNSWVNPYPWLKATGG